MCTISTPKKWSKSRQKVEKTRAKRWKNRKSEKNVFFSTFSKCQKMTNLCIFVHTRFFSKNRLNRRKIKVIRLIEFLISGEKTPYFCGYTPLFPVWKGESLENTRENSLSWSNPYYCRSNRVCVLFGSLACALAVLQTFTICLHWTCSVFHSALRFFSQWIFFSFIKNIFPKKIIFINQKNISPLDKINYKIIFFKNYFMKFVLATRA